MLKKLMFAPMNNVGLLVFRLATGFIMVLHGLFKFKGGRPTLEWVGSGLQAFGINKFHYQLGIFAALSEMFGGLMVMLGLFTRLASLMLVGTLAVATLVMKDKPFNEMSHP